MYKYIRSDLVMENATIESIKDKGGYSEERSGDILVCRLSVSDDRESQEYKCDVGNYVTIYYPRSAPTFPSELSRIIGKEIKRILRGFLNNDSCVLVVGIGNRDMSADALGPLTSDGVFASRRGASLDKKHLRRGMSVCTVECGVVGKTGIESLETVRGIAKEIRADAVIAVDALAARDVERLMSTVQISDRGISPGAGIGNRRLEINKKTLGIPVLAIGIPTVVSASTIVASVLRDVGYDKIAKEAENAVKKTADLFVTPKDCDVQVRNAAYMLSSAINNALLEYKE